MSQYFTNTQVDLNLIPRLETLEYKPVSKNYLKLLILNRSMALFVFVLIIIVILSFVTIEQVKYAAATVLAIAVSLLLVNTVFTILAFKKRCYAIREKDIVYAKGLLIHQNTTVPFKRIQHIELHQSFLAKKFDVATLNIYTAGESGGDLKIQGLKTTVAETINELLSHKINELD